MTAVKKFNALFTFESWIWQLDNQAHKDQLVDASLILLVQFVF